MKTLFPKPKIPYFIQAPSYTHISSGVKTLHLLCHALNSIGQRAYLAIDDYRPGFQSINPDWLTPILDEEVAAYYKDYIAVYPDKIWGNPLNAKRIVRYLLAPKGKYGGPSTFSDTDMIWGVTSPIGGDNTLTIPPSDPDIFHLPSFWNGETLSLDVAREGSCFYAHKYDRIHGQPLLDITKDSKRLEGSQEEIAEILRKSEVCYLYEPSQIMLDAGLCGCQVVLIRTPYFNELPYTDWAIPHIRWNDETEHPESLTWRMDVLRSYRAGFDRFWNQLDEFVKRTQDA